MRLLWCFGRAVVRNAVKYIAECDSVRFVASLVHIARDTWDDYRANNRPDQLPAEVQALAAAPVADVKRQAGDIARQLIPNEPPAVQQALTDYLTQVPAMVRRVSRRPSDPTGTTLPPTLALKRGEDLVQFLPPKPPRFNADFREAEWHDIFPL